MKVKVHGTVRFVITETYVLKPLNAVKVTAFSVLSADKQECAHDFFGSVLQYIQCAPDIIMVYFLLIAHER